MRRLTATAATLVALTAVTGCEAIDDTEQQASAPTTASSSAPATSTPATPTTKPTRAPSTATTTEPAAKTGTALAALATLPVKGRAPMTGYDRDEFGSEWSDAAGTFDWSRNGCDTRNDILARDLQREVVESNGCVVTSGILAYEPYTGVRNYFFDKHDNDYDTDLDAEHIVALGNAWVTGAQQISAEQRAALANDPINVMMTDPSENRSKGDADFATWLPPNKEFRCSYAARQIAVKVAYKLWVTAPEKAAMERVLDTCPNEPLAQPDPQEGYTADKNVARPAASTPKPSPKPQQPASNTSSGGGANVYYENCDAARAAGAAPVRRGDPGYGSHLDRDGDGSGCE